MSTTCEVLRGDTFGSIARRVYGTEAEASRVARANPGVREPLTTGAILAAPRIPGVRTDRSQQLQSGSENEVAVLINGQRFSLWEEAVLSSEVDGIDTLEINTPLNTDDATFRATFRPFSYAAVEVLVGGALEFTGVMIGTEPSLEEREATLRVTAYSRAGVLLDCTAPASAFPLEFNGQTLQDIATTLVQPFGISLVFEGDAGPVFERVALAPTDKIFSFLTKLAQQRNLVIGSTPDGGLVFRPAAELTGEVDTLDQEEGTIKAITPVFREREFYSHVTGIQPVTTGVVGEQLTVSNPHLAGQTRPLTFLAQDTLGADLTAATEAKAARMFGNMVSYSVDVPRWRDSAGELWRANTSVRVRAPSAMVYSLYSFSIRRVALYRVSDAEVATLELVLPGVFSGVLPEALPWDE